MTELEKDPINHIRNVAALLCWDMSSDEAQGKSANSFFLYSLTVFCNIVDKKMAMAIYLKQFG